MLRKITAALSLTVLLISCGKDKAPPAPALPAWTEKASLPADEKRSGHVSFVIAGKSYVCGGRNINILGDLWEYNPQTNQWTEKASLPPGKERIYASAFVINGKGYVVGGAKENNDLGDVWEYNPANNTWAEKTSLPAGQERQGAIGFAIGSKGYIATGGPGFKSDLWEFDPSKNNNNGQWTKKASLPNPKGRHGAISFVSSGKGYMAAGYNGNYLRDLWQYDPVQNTWTERKSLPLGKERSSAAGFSVGDKGYLIGGYLSQNGQNYVLGNVWEYAPATNDWKEKKPLPVGKERLYSSGFTLNGKGYIVAGGNQVTQLSDIWQYDPAADQ